MSSEILTAVISTLAWPMVALIFLIVIKIDLNRATIRRYGVKMEDGHIVAESIFTYNEAKSWIADHGGILVKGKKLR